MRNPKIAQELLNLQNLIDQSSSAELDLSLRGHWAQYLCVRAAGFLENSLEAIYADFARARGSDPRVARFVAKQLERIYNPKTPTFLRTAGQFDETWERELAAFLNADPDRRKGGINSIIEYRNRIAHGESVVISPTWVSDYLTRSVEVLEFIEDQCQR